MDNTIPQEPLQKQCSKCKMWLDATSQHFYPKGKSSSELRSACKACTRKPNDVGVLTRMCPSCKQEKMNTSDFFYPDRKCCKICIGNKGREYTVAHKEQHKASMHKYYIAHKSEYRERDRQYKERHPEGYKEYSRLYQKRHREEILPRRRASYRANPEIYKRCSAAYRKRHPERVKEINRRSRLAHLEQANTHRRNYYARKKNAQGRHTAQDILNQYERQKGRCYYCKRKMGKHKHQYHADHVVPLTRGGTNWPDNIVVACPACNISKNNKLPHEWPEGGHLM